MNISLRWISSRIIEFFLKAGNKISRKDFLKKLWWVLLIPYVVLVDLMARRYNFVSLKKKLRISHVIPEGISFHDDVICVKHNGETRFMLAKCTHLGCRIDKVKNERLICPCHGSEFDDNGKVLKGPAGKNLTELEFEDDNLNNEYIIKLK